MISTILVATDGSEACAPAERYGAGLAARMRARLLGLSVVEDRLARGFHEDGLGVAPPSPEPVATYLRARAEAACRRLAERASSEGVEQSSEVVEGIADDRIAERGQQADIIVLGRDGHDAPHRTGLIGSVANGVMRKTAKSTLIVPSTGAQGGAIVLAFDGSPGSASAPTWPWQIATRLGEAHPRVRRLQGQGSRGGALRGGARHRGLPARAGARDLVHPRAPGREDRRLRPGGPGGAHRDGGLRGATASRTTSWAATRRRSRGPRRSPCSSPADRVRLGALAQALSLPLEGEADLEVGDVASLEEATPGS